MSTTQPSLDTIVALAKRRGFVFPTSSIYGGLANSYDYGPAGTEVLRAIRDSWWRFFITSREDMVGIDSQILLHPKTWVASGHVTAFNDPLVEDCVTHKRYRADHLIEEWAERSTENREKISGELEDLKIEDMAQLLADEKILSPEGNPLTEPKLFNLLFETAIGSVSGEKSVVYIRGETAQGIFTNFHHILDSTRIQLPFGVGQIGKSFRNEVTTGQFVFRTLEFEQAEIEYFFNPAETAWEPLFATWKEQLWKFVTEVLGINPDRLRWRDHTDTERSHYSKATVDLEYHYPFGWKELWGLAYRTDYDLKQHMEHSGESLEVINSQTGEKTIPHVIEPAVGINRLFLMVLLDAYREDTEKNRVLLSLPNQLAPYQVAIFPLVKNKPELVDAARTIYEAVKQQYRVAWDDRGNIGKRYLAQDEIGTPFCITVDYQSLEDDTVTIRNRDTADQERIAVANVVDYLSKK
ncbi:MAG: glycine--tRNA ligase [Patescibacteria group bacterium]